MEPDAAGVATTPTPLSVTDRPADPIYASSPPNWFGPAAIALLGDSQPAAYRGTPLPDQLPHDLLR